MQLILRGDFYQLPPVPDEFTGDPGEAVFKSPVWKKLRLQYVHLKKVQRCDNVILSR